ncbi:winged helix DNA-binding domain-containing protein [Enterococcus faecalis]|nr:winged helix DNA-binding domain-containing protein [Enterococcus faecalis]
MDKVSSLDIIIQRFYNQGLTHAFTSIEELLTAALGIQSQYINHGLFNLAIRLHLEKDQKVYQTLESVILAWGQRQTYHFYSKPIWQKMTSFLAEDQIWVKNYFQKENLDLDKALEELRGKLAQPQLRSQLALSYGDRWNKLFIWSALFLQASRQGQLYQKLLPEDRLVIWEESTLLAPLEVSKEMLEAYFSFYGPATIADAAHFFGIKQAQIHRADLAGLKKVSYGNRAYYFKNWQTDVSLPEVLVLGKFDPLLIAYKHKELLIAPEAQAQVWKKGGQIAALILIRGQFCGTWTMAHQAKGVRFTVTSPKPLALKHQAKIRRIFKDYAKWLGKSVVTVSFE